MRSQSGLGLGSGLEKAWCWLLLLVVFLYHFSAIDSVCFLAEFVSFVYLFCIKGLVSSKFIFF